MTRTDEILVQLTATILAGYIAAGMYNDMPPEYLRAEAIDEARHIIKEVILQDNTRS